MNDWELLLKLVIGVSLFLGANWFLLFRDARRDALVAASYKAREAELLKLIRNLANRIHANDLPGYAMLQGIDQKIASPASQEITLTGNDEIDAINEERRNRLIERELAELNGGRSLPPEGG